jgi:anti-anti-sigma factor
VDRIMDITTDGTTLVLAGDFDVRSTGEVRAALHDVLDVADERGEEDVVVDLSGVRAVDHTALRVLAVATRRARRADHHLWLRGCRPAVRRMLHLTHLRRAVEVERGVEVSPITHPRAVTTR